MDENSGVVVVHPQFEQFYCQLLLQHSLLSKYKHNLPNKNSNVFLKVGARNVNKPKKSPSVVDKGKDIKRVVSCEFFCADSFFTTSCP